MPTPLVDVEDEVIDARVLPSGDEQDITILSIEDDSNLAELIVEFLERKRDYFDVITETDPRDGLERLSENGVDCIVSDYDMPHMDGIAVLQKVRDDYPEVPFILFTGKGSEEIASEAIAKGATDYLQKGSGTNSTTCSPTGSRTPSNSTSHDRRSNGANDACMPSSNTPTID